MALYFKSDNNDSSLKTATSVSWAGIGRRRYTHFIAVDATPNTSFQPQYFWVNGNLDASNSHTIRCNYESTSVTSLRVRGAVFSEATASKSGITGYRRAILAVSGTGKDDGSDASGYYARMLTIDSSSVVNLAKSSWVASTTGGNNDLKPSSLVIGDIFAQDNTRNVRDTSIYYVGSADRFLSDDEIIGMGLGEIQPLDYFGDDLVELWDFQQDSDRALTGLIQGTQLVPKGTKYEWTTDAPLPVSRNTFIGIGQANILAAPAWLSALTNGDNPTIGTCTSTSTVMANGIGSDGSEPEGWEPVKISNGAESSSGFNHYTIDNTNNMDMLLWVYYARNSGSLPDDFEISAKINTLPITLTKTSITSFTEGWLTFEIPPEVKEVDVHGRITQLKYFYTTHLTKDSKDITYDKEWQTVMDLTVSSGGTETATAAINGTSSLVGISIYHATEPTTPCVVYIKTSTDSGSTYTPYKATYGVTNAAYTVTDMIRLPAGTTNVKAIATDNTGLSATVKVIVGVIKGMKEVV